MQIRLSTTALLLVVYMHAHECAFDSVRIVEGSANLEKAKPLFLSHNASESIDHATVPGASEWIFVVFLKL